MPKIVRSHLSDVIPKLNAISELDVRAFEADGPQDLFLCALGFEPRCLTLPGKLAETKSRFKRAAFFRYETNIDDNSIHLSSLIGRLNRIAPKAEPVDADSTNFSRDFRTLLNSVSGEAVEGRSRITVDISVMANRLLLRCMQVLLEYDVELQVIYSEAETYHPTRKEYELHASQWCNDELLGLEQGVGEVAPSTDHPGHGLDPLPDFLILFASFRGERSKAVISFVDSSLLTHPDGKVIWIFGIPHLAGDFWRLEAMKRINAIGENARNYEISTFDYRETLQVLESLHAEFSERYKITLSPLGSKMQALGSALFCYMHPDVRVIFSSPKEYNAAQYSKGCKAVWGLDFGSLSELRRTLDQVGTLRIEE